MLSSRDLYVPQEYSGSNSKEIFIARCNQQLPATGPGRKSLPSCRRPFRHPTPSACVIDLTLNCSYFRNKLINSYLITFADIIPRRYGAVETIGRRDRIAGGPVGLRRERRASQVDETGRPVAGHRVRRVRGPERGAHQDGDGTRRYHVPGHAKVQERGAVHVGIRRVRPVPKHHRATHIAVSVRGRSPTAAEVEQQLDRGQRCGRAHGRHRIAVGPGRRQGEPVGRRGRHPTADGVCVRHGH